MANRCCDPEHFGKRTSPPAYIVPTSSVLQGYDMTRRRLGRLAAPHHHFAAAAKCMQAYNRHLTAPPPPRLLCRWLTVDGWCALPSCLPSCHMRSQRTYTMSPYPCSQYAPRVSCRVFAAGVCHDRVAIGVPRGPQALCSRSGCHPVAEHQWRQQHCTGSGTGSIGLGP
jgi:hypothetical protein